VSESRQQSEQRSRDAGPYRDPLSAQADNVMSHSRPTPTPDELEAIVTGRMHPDEKNADTGPSMPPLHEQYAVLEAERERSERREGARPAQQQAVPQTPPRPPTPPARPAERRE
jgi:hypothetical protein